MKITILLIEKYFNESLIHYYKDYTDELLQQSCVYDLFNEDNLIFHGVEKTKLNIDYIVNANLKRTLLGLLKFEYNEYIDLLFDRIQHTLKFKFSLLHNATIYRYDINIIITCLLLIINKTNK